MLDWDIPAVNGIIHIIEAPLTAPPMAVSENGFNPQTVAEKRKSSFSDLECHILHISGSAQTAVTPLYPHEHHSFLRYLQNNYEDYLTTACSHGYGLGGTC